ncbi:hypothetical protein [Mitsuaria sp. 7]|uniref:hypothetical protein n=1 Tax=Mitsuaria sp. 7 TaxID=1658665 RepID=UPI00082AC0A1|nr:hypothetical protein [Mitsuaria sp. 7]
MTHIVTGLIARTDLLSDFSKRQGLAPPVTLSQGLALLPTRDDDLDAFLPLPLSGSTDGFVYLCDQLLAVLAELSRGGRVMYFETDYFGGAGTQGTVLFDGGRLAYGPRSSERIGPINEALALLGVTVQAPARDAFDTLGLGSKRRTEDWIDLDRE